MLSPAFLGGKAAVYLAVSFDLGVTAGFSDLIGDLDSLADGFGWLPFVMIDLLWVRQLSTVGNVPL
ncbi:hypothetical protein COB72_05550 [bacterium]|nr:MAG: hypothetical protein COB72_05550 [bacterium]